MINNPLILKDPSGHFWEEVAEFGVGLVAQVQHDFSMGMVDELAMKPNESAAMVTGRLVGSVVSMVGGGAEATFGAATMAAGAAACGTGVLCPAGAAALVGGGVMTAHGASMFGQGVGGFVESGGTLIQRAMGSGNGGGSGTSLSFGRNHLNKFRSHAREMREVARNEYGTTLGRNITRSQDTQAEFKSYVQTIVDENNVVTGSYNNTFANARWYRSSNGTGNGLVILKENGEFITHLRIDQGGRLIDDYFKLVSEANG